MNWSALAGSLATAFKALAGAGETVAKADPALAKTVTFGQILAGVDAARDLDWQAIAAAVDAKFRDPMKDAVAVEDIAAEVALFVPGAATVEQIAALIVLLCRLGIIAGGTEGYVPPKTAVPDPYGSAHGPPGPFI